MSFAPRLRPTTMSLSFPLTASTAPGAGPTAMAEYGHPYPGAGGFPALTSSVLDD